MKIPNKFNGAGIDGITHYCDPLSAAVSVFSTVMQMDAQSEARAASKREFEASQRRADIQNVRAVRQRIRETRLAQAGMSNVAAQTGAIGGSGLAGGVSSAGSQMAGNLSYMSQIAEQNTAMGKAQVDAASAMGDAAIWGAVGGIAKQWQGLKFPVSGAGSQSPSIFTI
jgi:transcription elongation factor